MQKIFLNDEKAMNHYRVMMDNLIAGTREYDAARRLFAWYCNRWLAKLKRDERNLKIADSVGGASDN